MRGFGVTVDLLSRLSHEEKLKLITMEQSLPVVEEVLDLLHETASRGIEWTMSLCAEDQRDGLLRFLLMVGYHCEINQSRFMRSASRSIGAIMISATEMYFAQSKVNQRVA